MAIIELKAPDETCVGCPYNHREVIDHAYYGELTVKHTCQVFGCDITNNRKCDKCKKLARTETTEA